MTGQCFRGSILMFRRGLAAVVLAGLALMVGDALPAAMAPLSTRDNLSGTWQVQRTCLTGCVGTTMLTERVSPSRSAVFMATGTAAMVLYRVGGKKVLVHAATSSSLLTIRRPGQMMSGPSVGQDGSTFRVTWSCVAGAGDRHSQALRPEVAPGVRGIC